MRTTFFACSPLVWLLLTPFLLSGTAGELESIEVEVTTLMRKDVPNDFPYQVFNEDFAVFVVKLKNRGSDEILLEPDNIRVEDPKGKRLERALPTDMAPKLVKYESGGGSSGIHSGSYAGYPTYGRGRYVRSRGIGAGEGPGKVDAGAGIRIRTKLEEFQLPQAYLLPEQSLEGYFYLKSDKSGRDLEGSTLEIWGRRFDVKAP